MRQGIGALIGVLVLTAVGCGGDDNPMPTGPSPTPITAAPESLRVNGPTSLRQPGESGQLTVMATFADGTTRDVTAQASCYAMPYSYSYTPYEVVHFSARTGCAFRAAAFGIEEVEIAYPPVAWWPPPPGTAVTHVTFRVVPDGRFVLHGRVTEAGYPLKDATVKLTSTLGELISVADSFGNYMLAPVSGDVTVRAGMDGYVAESRRLTVIHDEEMNLELHRAVDATGITGVYRLTFTASRSCSLPSEARQRSYSANVIEGRTIGRREDLIVTLAGAEFVVWGNEPGFVGLRGGDTVRFQIDTDWGGAYGLVELIDLTKELYYVGTATATLNERSIVGLFSGTLKLVDRHSRATLGECQAIDHRIELTR